MLKKAFFTVCTFVFISLSYAQDTLKPDQTTAGFEYENKYVFEYLLNQATFNKNYYSKIEIGTDYTSGGYRTAQSPEKQNAYYLKTDGYTRLKNNLFSGSFEYSRKEADSVRNTHNFGMTEKQPYYFFSLGAGEWEVVTYKLSGNVMIPFSKTWKLNAGIDFLGIQSWRTQDPRPENLEQKQQYKIAVQKDLNKHHQLGAGAILLIGNYETNVTYRNINYSSSLGYVDKVNYLSKGYGNAHVHHDDRTMFSDNNGFTVMGLYKFNKKEHTLILNANYKKYDFDFRQRLTDDGGGNVYGQYYQSGLIIDALYTYKKNDFSLLVGMKYDWLQGYDIDAIQKATNYESDFQQLLFQTIFTKFRNNKPCFEIGINTGYQLDFEIDGMNSMKDYARYNLQVAGSYFFYHKNNNFWKVQAAAGVDNAANNNLRIGPIPTYFTERVILYDFHYYNSNLLKASFNIQYNFLVKGVHSYVNTHIKHVHAGFLNDISEKPALLGKDRLWWQLSLGVFL